MTSKTEATAFGTADMAMIATCILWGIGAVVVKNAIGDTPDTFRVFVFNGLRMPLVSLMLFAGVKVYGGSVALRKRDIPFVAWVSFAGMFLHIMTSLSGLKLSNASNMGIIFATVPLFTLLISFAAGIEKPTARLASGIIIGMTGVLALSWHNGGIALNPGDALLVASCLFWAFYTVYSKRILNSYSPVVAIAWVFFFASVYQMPVFLYQLRDQTWGTISASNWINLAIGTIGSYTIANALYYYAIHAIGPVRAGIYNNLTPGFTLLFAAVLRGEEITVQKIAGLAIILAGIAVTKLPERTRGMRKRQDPLPQGYDALS